MARAATGSAHAQPRVALRTRPTRSTAERYVHSKVCLESATALAEPSSRPALRCAADRNGMTASESAAMTMPGTDRSASPVPVRARTESTAT